MNGLNLESLERDVLEFGSQIFDELNSPSVSFFDTQYYVDKFMEMAMRDEALKVSLFRFVDVLPSLPDGPSVIRHVQEYFQSFEDKIPELLRKGLHLSPSSLAARVIARAVKQQVHFVAKRFIVGETPHKALPALQRIRSNKMAFTVDLVGEAVLSEVEAQHYQARYLELLDCLAAEVVHWPEQVPIIENHRLENTPINISVKLSALYSQGSAVASEHTVSMFMDRFGEILSKAKEFGAFVNVDMEDSSLTSITLETFKRILESAEFRDYERCGIALQAYLRRTKDDVRQLISWAKRRDVPITVRLVKGAYWDTETILATQKNWPIPVWQNKSSSDAEYEAVARTLLEHSQLTIPAFASHNIRSLCYAIKLAEHLGVPPSGFELQTLYGMGDPIKQAFTSRGYLVREYAPIGKLIPAMGYLVRRLLENTSNEGFLRASFHEGERPETLLKKPEVGPGDTGRDHLGVSPRVRFSNIPLKDFSIPRHRSRLAEAVEQLRTEIQDNPRLVSPVIGGKTQTTENSLRSLSPEDSTLTVAKVDLAGTDLAEEAVARTAGYFPTWRSTSVEKRAEVMFKTAELLDTRREKILAAIILETGKPYTEADADIAEAIDFLNYYAHEALRLAPVIRLGEIPGEQNSYFYEPRGVTLVISPWNFPLAIPCGMLSAALVTGNTAILKPAGQSTFVAQLLFEALLDAGLPEDAAAFLPGRGGEIGPFLASHPLISTILFTGSKEVGLELITRGANLHPKAEQVKRIVAEMGGKNAVIIDDDADLDDAVKGVVYSAFGYQGQKCSACSRAIVVGDSTYNRFLRRLSDAVRSLIVGPASDPRTFVGPVIDDSAYTRIKSTIDSTRADCQLVAEGIIPDSVPPKGYYVSPTVFSDIPSGHQLLSTEIFGPVLAVLKANDFSSALEIALDSEYGLTGGVFSRSPQNIQTAVREFRVGNLYVNRGCTGAKVFYQPFGGARMSGVGSKAGGPDYLLQFLIPRTITENTVRRGFAPL